MRCGGRLDCRGKGAVLITKTKIGVISKKKKKVHACSVTTFTHFWAWKWHKTWNNRRWLFFFFFLEIAPTFVFGFRSAPLPRQSSLQPHLTVPLLMKKNVGGAINFVSWKFVIQCPDFCFSKYGNPTLRFPKWQVGITFLVTITSYFFAQVTKFVTSSSSYQLDTIKIIVTWKLIIYFICHQIVKKVCIFGQKILFHWVPSSNWEFWTL